RQGREEQKFFPIITRQNKFDRPLVQDSVNKPTILNHPKAYTVFILTFDFRLAALAFLFSAICSIRLK
ncbi:hypothetical protein QHH03_13890, partial [Aphanizomenon sp. 202]|nr:hypothetical protein [Aphanizomenon sp. 202]